MKKVSDIPLRLGLARLGHMFKTTASIGDLKEDTVLAYCTEELSREYPQYKRNCVSLMAKGAYKSNYKDIIKVEVLNYTINTPLTPNNQ